MKISKPIVLSIATSTFLVLGYFGSQYFTKNIMFTIAAAVGGGGAISYILQKPSEQKAPSSQPEMPITVIKTPRKTKKS